MRSKYKSQDVFDSFVSKKKLEIERISREKTEVSGYTFLLFNTISEIKKIKKCLL